MPSLQDIQTQILSTYLQRSERSKDLYHRATGSMPGGDTRSITFFHPYPTFLERGRGCHVVDVDGNEYLDLLNNYTALIHGHAHERINAAIADQAAKGVCHAAPFEIQIALADEIVRRLPSVEKVRFCNSGTETILNAVRVARAFTGRLKILKMIGGYHGMWETVQVSIEADPAGPPSPVGSLEGPGLSPRAKEETIVAPFNDLQTTSDLIRKHRNELAAVLVEPVMGAAGMIPGERSFLQGLREVCRETNVLLIFDEIITLRLAVGGAQSMHDIQPDLTTVGKLIGGGLPVGAFGGRADVMAVCDPRGSNPVFHSGTFTGSPVVMAAGLAALKLLDEQAVSRINRLGDRLRNELQQVLDDTGLGGHATGVGSILQMHFTNPPVKDCRSAHTDKERIRPWLHLALLNRGMFVALRGLFSISTVMGDKEIDDAVIAFREAVEEIKPLWQDWKHLTSPADLWGQNDNSLLNLGLVQE